jgi:SAM-dependent methyltransferase
MKRIEATECHICGARELVTSPFETPEIRVSSDCKPVKSDAPLAVCLECGTLQTVVTPAWRDLCRNIYSEYQTYFLASGEESQTRSASGAPMSSRSALLVSKLRDRIPSGESAGKLLEVGCGNGPFLREFARAFPGWLLYGTEFDDKDEETLRRISGFVELFVGGVEAARGKFDGIVMVHVLEHLERPKASLSSLRAFAATDRAFLFVQVPDCAVNPFALMTIDHATHFTPNSLARLVKSAGWRLKNAELSWIPKEISAFAVAGAIEEKPDVASAKETAAAAELLEGSLIWLKEVVETAKGLARGKGPFGIFGTAIAGTWLAANLLESGLGKFFFVDEQKQRAGQKHLGKPVYLPEEVSEDAVVLVAVAPEQSASITQRLQSEGGARYVSVKSPLSKANPAV